MSTRLLNMVTLSVILIPPALAGTATCLKYEPETVTFIEKLDRETFPDRPDFETGSSGDEAESGFYLSPDSSVCTVGGSGADHAVRADDGFGIEDEHLRVVPPAVAMVLRAHVRKTDYKDCAQGEFVGSPVDLEGRGRKMDWIAKTADGCAWGAATAQIWILKNEKAHYRVVLYSGGQAVLLSNSKTNGLRDLTMSSGTAGHYADTLLKFDGHSYKVFKSCAIDLQH